MKVQVEVREGADFTLQIDGVERKDNKLDLAVFYYQCVQIYI